MAGHGDLRGLSEPICFYDSMPLHIHSCLIFSPQSSCFLPCCILTHSLFTLTPSTNTLHVPLLCFSSNSKPARQVEGNFRAVIFVVAVCLSLLEHKHPTLIVLDKSLGKGYSDSQILYQLSCPLWCFNLMKILNGCRNNLTRHTQHCCLECLRQSGSMISLTSVSNLNLIINLNLLRQNTVIFFIQCSLFYFLSSLFQFVTS